MTQLFELKPMDKNDNYLSCYRKRLEYANNALINFGNQLKEKGFTVLCTKDMVKFIYVTKDGKHCFIGFTDVPYRWYVNISWEPNTETGAGRNVTENYKLPTFDEPVCPFTIEEITSYLAPNPKREINYLTEL